MNTTHPFLPSDFEPNLARGHIVRTLYTESLQALNERKVVILQAPPGFGKQSLLSYAYKKSHGIKIWLRFSEKDDDKPVFINKLLHALALSQIQLSNYEAQNLQRSSADEAAYLIAKVLADRGKVTFFFAGIHHLTHPFIKTLLAALLLGTGQKIRFMMSCNQNHALSIASLTIDNQVHYINNQSLKFSTREALKLINLASKIKIKSSSAFKQLNDYVQGSGIALTLIKNNLQQGMDLAEVANEIYKGNQHLDDYFWENSLCEFSKAQRQTYIVLSAVEQFTLAQASSILGQDDLDDLNAVLDQQGFLLSTLDKGQQWFYYPVLFRHYLERLRDKSLTNNETNTLRQHSAHWLYNNGYFEEAINSILACHDYDTAALWLVHYTAIAKRKGNHEQFMLWLQQLPASTLNLHPTLAGAYTLCLILQKKLLQSDANTLLLSKANPKHAADKLQIERSVPLLAMAAFTIKDKIDSLNHMDHWIKKWEFHSEFRSHEDYNLEIGLAKLIKGFYSKCRSQFSASNIALNAARKHFEAYGSDYGIAWTDTVHTLLLAKQGLEFEALLKAREGLQFIQRHLKKDIDIHHMLSVLVSTMYYQQADYENARAHFPRDIEALQSCAFTDILIAAYKTQSRFLLDDGNSAEAFTLLKKQIKQAESDDQDRLAFSLISELIVIMIHNGNIHEAQQYANAYGIKAGQIPNNPLLASLTYRARIYLLIAEQKYSVAQAIIEQRIANHIEQKRYAILAEYYRILAILHYKAKLFPEAEVALLQSLNIAASRNYISLYNIDKESVFALLQRLNNREQSKDIRQFILKLQKVLHGSGSEQSAQIDKLTKKEIQVIQLAESGNPTKELADELNVSQGTLKWHLHNIYDKLNVKNRTQAINKAKKLGYF
jgi:ATP/maltotriose-dependent transcriptional regulator MalT